MIHRHKNLSSRIFLGGLVGLFLNSPIPQVAFAEGITCSTSQCHSDFRKQKVIHGPVRSAVGSKGCEVCHKTGAQGRAVTGHPKHPRVIALSNRGINEVCLVCHDDVKDKLDSAVAHRQSVHKPITDRSCVACHNPHSSSHKALLNDKRAPDCCLRCHQDIQNELVDKSSHYKVVMEKDSCLGCHDQHSSEHEHLLKLQQPELCLKCHDKEQKAADGHLVKNITINRPGEVPNHKSLLHSECSGCHNPHGSRWAKLLREGTFNFSAPPGIAKDAQECVECHTKGSPEIVKGWQESLHAQIGVNCLTCHGVAKGTPGGYGHHDAQISMIVSPKVCEKCHKDAVAEMAKTSHGMAIAGREIKVEGGKPDPKTWPLPGIGRTYPDGGVGSCTICHARHNFSAASARRPEVCMSCHDSDGSADAWKHSAHGAVYRDPSDRDLVKTPGCVTCHMASTPSNKHTHDVTSRLSWQSGKKPAQREGADARRDAMFDACTQCHGNTWVENALSRIDETFKAGGKGEPGAWPHQSPAKR
ncbi:cytochrome c3 family protein [Bdellovibrionota bacterium FG-1]